jgi:hypothetical protein
MLSSDAKGGLTPERLSSMGDVELQAAAAALVREYARRAEADGNLLPVAGRTAVTATEAMMFASGLLKAAGLAVFELGLWESWGVGAQSRDEGE